MGRFNRLTDLGIYNPRTIRGTGTPSLHNVGRAWDAGTPSVEAKSQGTELANLLVTHHLDLGVQLVIWQRRIWSNIRKAEGWRVYRGTSPHTEHMHIELTIEAGAGLTSGIIQQAIGGAMTITLPANRDETIRRIQTALGVEVDGDPFTKTADAAEHLSAQHGAQREELVRWAKRVEDLEVVVAELREGNPEGWASFVDAVRRAGQQ